MPVRRAVTVMVMSFSDPLAALVTMTRAKRWPTGLPEVELRRVAVAVVIVIAESTQRKPSVEYWTASVTVRERLGQARGLDDQRVRPEDREGLASRRAGCRR